MTIRVVVNVAGSQNLLTIGALWPAVVRGRFGGNESLFSKSDSHAFRSCQSLPMYFETGSRQLLAL